MTEAFGLGNLAEELLVLEYASQLHFVDALFEGGPVEQFPLAHFFLRRTSVYDYSAYFLARLNFGFAKFGGVLHSSSVSVDLRVSFAFPFLSLLHTSY